MEYSFVNPKFPSGSSNALSNPQEIKITSGLNSLNIGKRI